MGIIDRIKNRLFGKQPSDEMSSLAGSLLSDPYATERERSMAASILSQDETSGPNDEPVRDPVDPARFQKTHIAGPEADEPLILDTPAPEPKLFGGPKKTRKPRATATIRKPRTPRTASQGERKVSRRGKQKTVTTSEPIPGGSIDTVILPVGFDLSNSAQSSGETETFDNSSTSFEGGGGSFGGGGAGGSWDDSSSSSSSSDTSSSYDSGSSSSDGGSSGGGSD